MNKYLKIIAIVLIAFYILFGVRFYILILQHPSPVMICPQTNIDLEDLPAFPPEPSSEDCHPQPEPSLEQKITNGIYIIFFWPVALAVAGRG